MNVNHNQAPGWRPRFRINEILPDLANFVHIYTIWIN